MGNGEEALMRFLPAIREYAKHFRCGPSEDLQSIAMFAAWRAIEEHGFAGLTDSDALPMRIKDSIMEAISEERIRLRRENRVWTWSYDRFIRNDGSKGTFLDLLASRSNTEKEAFRSLFDDSLTAVEVEFVECAEHSGSLEAVFHEMRLSARHGFHIRSCIWDKWNAVNRDYSSVTEPQ